MAMTLTDVVKELELQTEYLDLTNDNLATFTKALAVEKEQEKLDKKEDKSESGSYQKNVLSLLTEIRDNGLGGGAGGQGAAGSFGSNFGAAFGENAGAGIGAGVGLAAIGAGIAGFISALAVADPIIEKYGGDFSGYKNAIIGIGEIFSEMDTKGLLGVGGLLAAGAALGMTAGFKGSARATGGMFFLGAGIGGFFSGLAVADAGMQALGSDGSGIVPLVSNIVGAIEVIAGSTAWPALATVLGAGALFGAVAGKKTVKIGGYAAVGLGLIGLGIGSFFAGLSIADLPAALGADGSGLASLMTNFAAGLGALAAGMRGNYEILAGFGPLAISVAGGLAALSAGDLVSSIINFASSIFQGDGKSTIMRLADDLQALANVDMDVANLDAMSNALNRLGDSIGNVADQDLGDFKSNLTELASAMQVLNPLLLAMYNGGTYKDESGWWDKEYTFDPGLKDVPIPEIATSFRAIGQITSTPIPTPEQLESAANSARVLQEATGDSTRSQTTDQIMENTEPAGGVTVVTVDNSVQNNSSSPTTVNNAVGKSSPPPPVTDI